MKLKNIILYVLSIQLFCININAVEYKELKNKYIRIIVDKFTGRFSLINVEGDPSTISDNNNSLLHSELPPNSGLFLNIDDDYYKFGFAPGKIVIRPIIDGNSILTAWKYRKIEVTQKLTIDSGPFENLDVSSRLEYSVANKDKQDHKIGLKIVLDSVLGPKDDLGFIVPGLGYLEYEHFIEEKRIPDYICAWDDISSPNFRFYCSFVGGRVVKPDYIVFAERKRLISAGWAYNPDISKKDKFRTTTKYDTAFSLRWEPINFKPGKKNGVAVFLGNALVDNVELTPFKLCLFCVQNPGRNVFDLIFQFHNSDDVKFVKDVKVVLTLPDGIEKVSGKNKVINYEKIQTGETRTIDWKIKAVKLGEYTMTVKLYGKYSTKDAVLLGSIQRKIVVE